MSSTMYEIVVGHEVRDRCSRKSKAVLTASKLRLKERADVEVVTNHGTVVWERLAPKHINQSPKYSRTVRLPAGVTPPRGLRVAYVRPRRNGAIVHDAVSGIYRIMRLDTGEFLTEEFPTTTQAGERLKLGV